MLTQTNLQKRVEMNTKVTFTNTGDNIFFIADEINRILDEHPHATIQAEAGNTLRHGDARNRGRHATVCQNGTIDIKCAAKTKPGAMNLIYVKRGSALTLTY